MERIKVFFCKQNAPTNKRKINWEELFWLFFAGSIIGFILEGLWSIVQRGGWENHAAVVWGPFCIIYGFGAASLYVAAGMLGHLRGWVQFILYALIGSGTEYLGSFLQEKLLGSTSWDYSGQFLNINGRISLKMTLIWGILGILFSYFVFPYFAILLSKMHALPWRITCIVLSVFMAVDLLVSGVAILRWGERRSDPEPSNAVEGVFDRFYHDDRMESIYGNMVFH